MDNSGPIRMPTILSRDNPRFKQWRRWATKNRERRAAGILLLDGIHLIEAFTAAGGSIDHLVVSESGLGRHEIGAWLEAHPDQAAFTLPDGMFGALAATDTPSGIVAVAKAPALPATPDLQADAVLLDGIQDPGNLGTLLRTAAASGIRQALLGAGCADPWALKTLRAGQGAQFELSIHEGVDLAGFLVAYQGSSLVTRLSDAQPLWEAPLDGPLAWIFGAEGQGVSAAVAAAADRAVFIPMPGRVESLNVAAAAAICLFEATRRRR